ncbi:Peroxidase superfamily protein [Prunus dulcis]|uniref:Peroxidase n=1 Tax=Prunus dulcis TaxID=3755 RepID=A0A4Y1QN76_PRUDU|nr:Peroxidase superfamily protein [Prunus dulcis]
MEYHYAIASHHECYVFCKATTEDNQDSRSRDVQNHSLAAFEIAYSFSYQKTNIGIASCKTILKIMRLVNLNVVFVSLLVLIEVVSVCNGRVLSPAFYRKSCPQIGRIVRSITWSKVAANPALAAKLLRLHYHDCFVRGCDASILIDSTSGNTAEKDAAPNRSIGGYDVIDEIKTKLEEECPDIVSCADIVALAARDAVSYQFGRPMWQVLTGRKDGRVSLTSEASRDLPSGNANFTTLQQQFAGLGLNIIDLVALSESEFRVQKWFKLTDQTVGTYIGVAHCAVFQRRLNATGKGDADPSLDPEYAQFLRTQCTTPPNPAVAVALDANSSVSFDSHYFVGLRHNKGLLRSDAALLTDPRSARVVKSFQGFHVFMANFGLSMKKMGVIGVKKRCPG